MPSVDRSRRSGRSPGATRTWAAAAVAALVAADLGLVAAAASGDDTGSTLFTTMTQLGFTTGTTADTSRASGTEATARRAVNSAETVPQSALTQPESGAAQPGRGGSASSGSTGTTPSTTPSSSAPPVVVQRGDGHFTVVAVPATSGPAPSAPTTGRVVRFTVEMEGGLSIDPVGFATTVARVLADPRGWQPKDDVRFVNVSPAEAARGVHPDLRIRLTSPATTDSLCAPLQTQGQVSCHNGGSVVLNSRRWLLGAEAYGNDVDGYRTYLVNHEVGHGIGHGHASCAGVGKVAPVMMQQTYGLKGCTAWPWPSTKPA